MNTQYWEEEIETRGRKKSQKLLHQQRKKTNNMAVKEA